MDFLSLIRPSAIKRNDGNGREIICALDVGTTKVCALIAELDEQNGLHVVGAGRTPTKGMRRGLVVNTTDLTAVIGQAITEAENTAEREMRQAYVGITGSHITATGSHAVLNFGRSGRTITREDTQRALDQARNIAVPNGREVIHVVPRTYSVDEQKGVQDPVGMFGYRLEVDALVITGATSAINNLVSCVLANGVEIEDMVLQPLASAEAVLTDDERQLGVALVDVGGGTTDLAIFVDGAPWYCASLELGGDHFVRDVASGLRMPYAKAEALIKQFGHATPERVPADAEVRSGAFGQEGQQTIHRRILAEILNARAQDVAEALLADVKRSAYDALLPAGVVLTGGVSQLPGFPEVNAHMLGWPVRIGQPDELVNSVIDLDSPEYATAVGLLLWGLRRGTTQRIAEPPRTGGWDRVIKWLRNLLP